MAEPLNKEQVQQLLDESPYIGFMKLEVVSMNLEDDQIVIKMPMRPEFERRRGPGQYHGGAIAALIDIAGDYALVMIVGGGVPTINLRVDFLSPGTSTSLTATANTRRLGRSVAVVDVDVHDDDGKLCAVGRGTYSPNVG